MSNLDASITVVSLFGEDDEQKVRTSAARLLMSVAIGILEGESADQLTGGAWVLAMMPDGEVPTSP